MPPTVLLGCEGITRAFGAMPLFESLSLSVFERDRLGLVGPNGSGKSTLLRTLAGIEAPDAGAVTTRRGVRIALVEQDSRLPATGTVADAVERGLDRFDLPPAERSARAAIALGRAGFVEQDQEVATLSGGWRKRVAIARALAEAPDVLLLDEPTNHLDIDGIAWLEELLATGSTTAILVSHDRWLLERVATRMVELNRRYARGLFECAGSYSDFLERREAALAAQNAHHEALANRVRREIEWLRRGPKARTKKSQARVKQADRLIDELDDLRARAAVETVGVELAASGRKTKRLLVAEGVSKSFGERVVLDGLDLTLVPGRRLGVLGANGSGKTTLLRLLAGELAPDRGTIRRADALATVYFEQSRETLDLDASLRRGLAPEGDIVVYRGREQHVAGWAQRFLFRPEQLDQPVRRLSGGERARILIARAMLRPADLLILDEPTNDLDIDTLEVLEESLSEFTGALVLVTHDRFLLDRISNQLLALDGSGNAAFFADYAQVLAERERPRQSTGTGDAPPERGAPASRASRRPPRLSYLEQREWDAMEGRILDAEGALAAAEAALADPAVASDPAALQERAAAADAAREAVERLYARWTELEAKLSPPTET